MRAVRVPFAGSKAAHLARAAAAGLPVLPGFVVPYGEGAHGGDGAGRGGERLRRAWQELSEGGARPLVVRSSSPREDTQESSLAGQFASVLDVRDWHGFRAAVRTVLDSAHRPDGTVAPMAVLVQPMLAARVGGVLFGADPVAGRADRMLVSAVRGGPDALVSGGQAGTTYWLGPRGRLSRTEPADAEQLLGPSELRRLARLARRARAVFGGPQDIEFGFDGAGRLWLFQSRPITAMAARPGRGARLLGPGPVAETLPDQLDPLEEDLWVAPMARGLAAALDIGGTAPRRQLRAVPVVTTVGGRAAADLRLLGAAPPRHRWPALLNPAPGARRLAAAWRVGRLTSALPGLATDLVADVDRRLAGTPSPDRLTRPELVAALRWTRTALVPLHAQEALAGALLPEPRTTAAGTALTALAEARAEAHAEARAEAHAAACAGALAQARAEARAEARAGGVPDHRVVAARPVVLALVPPSLSREVRLPEDPAGSGGAGGGPGASAIRTVPAAPADDPAFPARTGRAVVAALPPREALRLRIRWVQELQVRLVREAARRLAVPDGADRTGGPSGPGGTGGPGGSGGSDWPGPSAAPGTSDGPGASDGPGGPDPSGAADAVNTVNAVDTARVGLLRWHELVEALEGGTVPGDFGERLPQAASAPLPDAFRLAEGGTVVAERPMSRSKGKGKGKGRIRIRGRSATRGRDPGSGEGRGVSGGRAAGTAWDGTGPRPPDAVLVVRTLDPALAPLLPSLAGLVAQTGSPLSHLAVLARECGLPTVVGATDAVRRYPPGSHLTVDGTTGDVRIDATDTTDTTDGTDSTDATDATDATVYAYGHNRNHKPDRKPDHQHEEASR